MSFALTSLYGQKTGTIKDKDELTKIALDFHVDYATNNHELWDEMLNDDAEVHVNNSKMANSAIRCNI